MTRLEKIGAARAVLNAAIDSFSGLCAAAVDDALPPEVAIGEYDGSSFHVEFIGEAPFAMEVQAIPSGGWTPVSVNSGGYGDANIVTDLSACPEGFNWRAVAAAGGDHVSEYATGEVLPEAFSTE